MTHSDFSIGHEFISGGKRWRCTDIATRTIAAVCLSDHPDDESWYNGPPYAVVERVFDEYDLEGCATVDSERETAPDELSDVISLRHRDGSMFLLTNARIEHRGEWLLVRSERHGSHVFREDEVTHWRSRELSSRREPMGESTEELVGDLYYMLSDALIRPVKELDREGES